MRECNIFHSKRGSGIFAESVLFVGALICYIVVAKSESLSLIHPN
jgi:hypothetical protein